MPTNGPLVVTWPEGLGADWLLVLTWPEGLGADWLLVLTWPEGLGADWLPVLTWSEGLWVDWLLVLTWPERLGIDWLLVLTWPVGLDTDWLLGAGAADEGVAQRADGDAILLDLRPQTVKEGLHCVLRGCVWNTDNTGLEKGKPDYTG